MANLPDIPEVMEAIDISELSVDDMLSLLIINPNIEVEHECDE